MRQRSKARVTARRPAHSQPKSNNSPNNSHDGFYRTIGTLKSSRNEVSKEESESGGRVYPGSIGHIRGGGRTQGNIWRA